LTFRAIEKKPPNREPLKAQRRGGSSELSNNKMKKNGIRPVPPGEILDEEFLKPLA
jgi:hypothetical protein